MEESPPMTRAKDRKVKPEASRGSPRTPSSRIEGTRYQRSRLVTTERAARAPLSIKAETCNGLHLRVSELKGGSPFYTFGPHS
jgi:hypothetical protein